jgi:hypothetical protein
MKRMIPVEAAYDFAFKLIERQMELVDTAGDECLQSGIRVAYCLHALFVGGSQGLASLNEDAIEHALQQV